MTIFGVDIFCFKKKFLVFNLVSRNLKIKYRRSIFGFFWTLLVPLGTALVYYAVFQLVLNVKIPHYLAFILTGILPWTFFSQTVLEGMEALVSNSGILNKVPVPVQVFPFVGTVTNFISLALSSPVVLAAFIFTNTPVSLKAIWIIPSLACLFFITYGMSVILSFFFVYLRDLKHVFTVIMQLWFYGTPVIYRAEMIPNEFQWLLYLNPIGHLFAGFHCFLFEEVPFKNEYIFVPMVWSVLIFFTSTIMIKLIGSRTVESL